MSLELVSVEGARELRDHEKTALHYLKEHIAGPGYLIPSLLFGKLLSNREIDAVLILPDMIVLVELKDYFGRVEIPNLNDKMRLYDLEEGTLYERGNPCNNLAYSAKVVNSLAGGVGFPMLRVAGALILTNDRLDELVVEGEPLDERGAVAQMDLTPSNKDYAFLGGIVVCRLPAAPRALEALRAELAQGGVAAQALHDADLARLKDAVLGRMKPLPAGARRRVGTYLIDGERDALDEDYRLHVGHQDVTGLPVWLKEYHSDILSVHPDQDRELLLRGASALSTLGAHPNLPTYQDYCEEGDRVYVVLRREEGAFLRAVMQAGGMTLVDKLSILRDLLEGLSHIHAHHEGDRTALCRDLRPECVYVTASGAAQLFNFDCTRLPAQQTALDRARRRALLWRAYASFELLHASLPEQVGPPTDVYSWGVVAYELLAGRHPYADEEKMALGKFTSLAGLGLALPGTFLTLVDRALSPLPETRPALVDLRAAVQDALDACR
jgi:serine/threonine-protein kinase